MPIPVVSIAQMREWEQASWDAGISSEEVIRNVGVCVARHPAIGECLLNATQEAQDQILVLIGKGNNGEDARQTVEPLKSFYPDVSIQVIDFGADESAELTLDRQPCLIIDGLFGIGLNRPLKGRWRDLIGQVNKLGAPIISIDTPSGLDADTGEPQGASIHADVTITLGAPKRGLIFPESAPYVGRLEVEPYIGLIDCPINSVHLKWFPEGELERHIPAPSPESHKGVFGHAAIIAGSLGYHGAAVLAARAAARAMPGLISVYTSPETYYPIASQLQTQMVHPWTEKFVLPTKATCILVGPGLVADNIPDAIKGRIREWWQNSKLPMIIDASALDWLPNCPFYTDAPRVLTPHPGEAARMLKTTSSEIQADRIGALREISKTRGNCTVLLKGRHTLIGRNDGDIYVNLTGNPLLARGGSGDVLAGFLAGLLAQPELQEDSVKTAAFAAWRHGQAADQLPGANWGIKELFDVLITR